MPRLNGDIVPGISVSGQVHLGVDGGNLRDAFDITSISPFGHIHQISGVFHDPIYGQSGVIRFAQALQRFETSVDGGLTFVAMGGGGSGLNAINGDLGPNIDIVGINGIDFSNPSAGIILGDVAALSGIIPVTSGIESINSQSGPHITIIGVNGVEVTAAGNEILLNVVGVSGIDSLEGLTAPTIDLFAVGNLFDITTPDSSTIGFDFTSLSGIIPLTSGIESVNAQSGPHLAVVGVNGVEVSATANEILIDGVGASGAGGGITSINTETGPAITIDGVNGATIITSTNTATVDVSALSGLIPVTSGIESINVESGPHITIVGVNGVLVSVPSSDVILIDAAPASGILASGAARCHAESFTSQTSVSVGHNFNTSDVLVQIQDASQNILHPDSINSTDPDNVIVGFNRPQTGRAVVIGCPDGGANQGGITSLNNLTGPALNIIGVSGITAGPSGTNNIMVRRKSSYAIVGFAHIQTTNFAVGDHFEFDSISPEYESGNIAVTSGNFGGGGSSQDDGIFTLPDNEILELTAHMSFKFGTTVGDIRFQWYDLSRSVFLGRAGRARPYTITSHFTFSPVASAFVDTTFTKRIELRINEVPTPPNEVNAAFCHVVIRTV